MREQAVCKQLTSRQSANSGLQVAGGKQHAKKAARRDWDTCRRPTSAIPALGGCGRILRERSSTESPATRTPAHRQKDILRWRIWIGTAPTGEPKQLCVASVMPRRVKRLRGRRRWHVACLVSMAARNEPRTRRERASVQMALSREPKSTALCCIRVCQQAPEPRVVAANCAESNSRSHVLLIK